MVQGLRRSLAKVLRARLGAGADEILQLAQDVTDPEVLDNLLSAALSGADQGELRRALARG